MRPRPTRSTLFPYTTLFRSQFHQRHARGADRVGVVIEVEVASAGEGRRFAPGKLDLRWRATRGRAGDKAARHGRLRSEEHTSELQSHHDLVCRLLLEKKKI